MCLTLQNKLSLTSSERLRDMKYIGFKHQRENKQNYKSWHVHIWYYETIYKLIIFSTPLTSLYLFMIILMETCKCHHGYLNYSFRIHSYIHTCKYKYIFYYDLNIITFCYATMNVFFNKSHWNFKYCLICIKWEEIFKLRYCATRYKKIHFQRYRFLQICKDSLFCKVRHI